MASAATATRMIVAVGTLVEVRLEGLFVNCRVTDVRYVWGKNQLQVEPVTGYGKIWIDTSRVSIDYENGITELCS